MKHKTEDYKISAVKYYINNEVSMDEVCEIFECKKTSLKRWIDRYEKDGSIKRHSRKSISYKVSNEQVKYAIKLLKHNEQITLEELSKLVKKKYKDFDITCFSSWSKPKPANTICWPFSRYEFFLAIVKSFDSAKSRILLPEYEPSSSSTA